MNSRPPSPAAWLFVSWLTLDPRAGAVRRDLANPYELHRTLWRAFPHRDQGGPGTVLHAVEWADDLPRVAVQSTQPPDWSFALDGEAGILDAAVDRWTPAPADGQKLGFRLRANPAVRREGRRMIPDDWQGQARWLAAAGERHGFRPHTVRVVAQTPRPVTKPRERPAGVGGRSVRHHHWLIDGVRYEGMLIVTDAWAFGHCLREGLGESKAFGYGLLRLTDPDPFPPATPVLHRSFAFG